MNWDSFFPTGYFAWALVVCAIGLALVVVIYFLIMSAIARRVNVPAKDKRRRE